MPPAQRPVSIRVRLPLAISAALAVVLVALGVVLNDRLERILVASATERLDEVAVQLTDLLARSGTTTRARMDSIADNPALVAALARTNNAAAIRQALHESPVLTPTARLLQVTTIDGACLGAVGFPEESRGGLSHPVQACVAPSIEAEGYESIAGPLMADGDSLFTDMLRRIPARNGGPDLLITWRLRVASPSALDAIEDLIADDAEIFIGGRGGVWTNDLTTSLPPQVLDTLSDGPHQFADARGDRVAVVKSIPSARWHVAIDRSRDAILAPASAFAGPIALAMAVAILFAVSMTYAVTRRFTAPLAEITTAASQRAEGIRTARVEARGNDELTVLAHAFNTMAERIDESQDELELRVAARTADLERVVTKLRKTRAELVRKDKLALLGELAGGVGHELRNPLGVIANTIYLLDRLLEDPSPRIRGYVEVLGEQLDIATRIVDDLLQYGRMRTAEKAPVDLQGLIEQELARLQEPPPGIRFEIDVAADATHAEVDPGQLRHVVFNLLTNAVQAVGTDGVVRVSSGFERDRVWLQVADDGPGVPEAVRSTLFEPLVTTKPAGIGMGLALSKALVQNNGGHLRLLESEGGAVFRVELDAPVAAAVR